MLTADPLDQEIRYLMKAVSETERSAFTKHACVWPLSEQTRQGLLSQTQLLRAQMRASCPFTVTGHPTTRRAAATDLVRAVRLARAIALPEFPRNSVQSAAQQGTLRRCTIDIAFTRSKMYLEICDFPANRLFPYMCTKGVRRTSRNRGAKSISATKHTRSSIAI